jgi:IclR family pca regulon transcriptional regulator
VKAPGDKDYVQSLERGLSVILAFAARKPLLTLAQLTQATGLTRPTVRRLVLTLERLGYVRAEGRAYSLTPRVLALGHAFTSSLNLTESAQGPMTTVAETVGHTCSLLVLDEQDAVFLLRVPAGGGLPLLTSSRMPAFATAAGRVLLAGQRNMSLSGPFPQLTPWTVTDPVRLGQIVTDVRERGWALVDQEYEEGVRSFSAPVRDSAGWVVAALGMSVPSTVDISMIKWEHVPALMSAADAISAALGAEYHGLAKRSPLAT